ncbi:MAG: aminopeptidase P family N-terminal domain-containing protein, partial [Deltaproteobacteria bacterium]|nr:aminopeptidase P family N-terminal domain-containing protein [Deltaproteobacteria bacterium]
MKEHFLKGKEVLKRYNVDAFFSPNKVNIRYFTGLDAEGFLLLALDKIYLFLPPLYYMLKQNLEFVEKIIYKSTKAMKQKIKEIGVERIAYDNGE